MMLRVQAARLLLTIVGIFTSVGCWVFDFGATHMYNHRWPPHAKFHNAQTLLFGSILGVLTIYYAWRDRGKATESLGLACLLGSLYWVTQIGSGLLPNTALVDPEFAASSPKPFGLGGPQPVIDVVILLLVGIACVLGKAGHNLLVNRAE
jgi:hypothetical protein